MRVVIKPPGLKQDLQRTQCLVDVLDSSPALCGNHCHGLRTNSFI